MVTSFFQIWAKCTNFKVSSLGLEFQVSRISSLPIDLGIFNEVSVSKFSPGLRLEGCGLDYITEPNTHEGERLMKNLKIMKMNLTSFQPNRRGNV